MSEAKKMYQSLSYSPCIPAPCPCDMQAVEHLLRHAETNGKVVELTSTFS